MQNNPVVWFEIYVQDMSRAKAFYESVFEVQLQTLDAPDTEPSIEMLAFPMQEQGTGAAGALVKMEGCPSGGNSTLVYFSCADCAVEAARAASNVPGFWTAARASSPNPASAVGVDSPRSRAIASTATTSSGSSGGSPRRSSAPASPASRRWSRSSPTGSAATR